MINEAAFELVVANMKETPVNNKKTFARYMLGEPLPEFEQRLMEAWTIANGECLERLAISFPQIAYAMLEYHTLPEKKRKKYLQRLVGTK